MTTVTTVPGWWGDVTRTGRLVASTADARVTMSAPDVEMAAPEPLLYLRADVQDDGLVVVGQGHETGHAWVWSVGRGWADLGRTHGACCVETDGRDVWWQTSATTYARLDLETGTRLDALVPTDPSGTSQGFLDCTEPSLLWTDSARVVDGLVLPQAAGAWLVGQHPTAEAILAKSGGIARVVLTRAGLFEPRAAQVGEELVVVVRATEGLIVVRGVPAAWPVWTPPPAPAPVDPTPEVPMTPREIVDAMVWGGQQADRLHPGLRQSDCDAWMQHAAEYAASRWNSIGRKARAPGSRVSPDTMAAEASGGMYCVSIIRDNPPGNEWRNPPLDYGLVTGQHYIPVTPKTPDVGPVEPPPPPTSALEARVAALEARVHRHLKD